MIVAAYYFSISGECCHPGCTKRGEYEVRNSCNARVGAFCLPHAKRRVAELNKPSEDRR